MIHGFATRPHSATIIPVRSEPRVWVPPPPFKALRMELNSRMMHKIILDLDVTKHKCAAKTQGQWSTKDLAPNQPIQGVCHIPSPHLLFGGTFHGSTWRHPVNKHVYTCIHILLLCSRAKATSVIIILTTCSHLKSFHYASAARLGQVANSR